VGWPAKLSNVKHCAPCFFGGLPWCVGGSLQVPVWVGVPPRGLRSTSPCTYAQLPRLALSVLLFRQACAVCGGAHAVRGRAGFQALCWPPAHASAPVAGRDALLPAPLLPRPPPASDAPPLCAPRTTFLCSAAFRSARRRPTPLVHQVQPFPAAPCTLLRLSDASPGCLLPVWSTARIFGAPSAVATPTAPLLVFLDSLSFRRRLLLAAAWFRV